MPDVTVSKDWLVEHVGDDSVVILDTRPKVAYSYGHIPNSVSLTVDQMIRVSENGAHLAPDVGDASSLLGSLGIDQSRTVVVTGESMDPSAARVAWTLQYLGQSNTKILDVGIGTWQGLGLPLTRAQKGPTPSEFVPSVKGQMRIESGELKEALGKVTVLDARTLQEFFAGHIPGSVLIPFTDGVGQGGGLFESREFLQKMFEEKRITGERELVCYCMHGHRASSLFYQLQIAGFERVRLYDGSFVDWYSRRLGLE